MTSQYPNQLDTNVELPSVEDNITEIGGDAINGLRDAVFNIEETLGVDPQGSTTDVNTRISRSLNADGTLKADALSLVGLLTVPIMNGDVASNADISESKLHLDYTTTQLKTWIDQGLVRINFLSSGLADLISKTNRHIAHPSAWGRHETRDVDGYYGKYASANLQGIVTDLDTRIDAHIGDPSMAHNASAIFADDSNFLYSADNVQTALEYLNNLGLTTMVNHRDNDHDNGILSAQDVTLPGSKNSISIIESFPLYNVGAGNNFIRFTAPPSGFGQISRGDIVVVVIEGVEYTYDVSKIDTSTYVVYIVGVLTASGSASAYVHRTTEELSSSAVLKAVVIQESVTAVGGSIIKIINPNSPFIISSGTRPWEISDAAMSICLRWSTGEVINTGIDIQAAMEAISLVKSEWTVGNCVKALNNKFISYDMPVVAFDHNGEIGIVYDNPDGYLEIVGPGAPTAWGVLGFIEGEISYGLGTRKYYIDGYEYSGIRLISDATGNSDSSLIIKNIDNNLISQGVVASGIAKITPVSGSYSSGNSIEKTGSVIYTANAEHTLTVSSSLFSSLGTQNIGIKIYADTFSVLVAPAKRTLYELFLDGYSPPYAELRGMPRVEYYNCQELRPHNPENWFDVTAVSRTFGYSQKRVYYDGNYHVTLGDPESNGTISNPGNVVALPQTSAEGYQFRLYDGTFVNYLDFEIVNPVYTQIDVFATLNAIDFDIQDRISEDRYLQVATVLHDKEKFSHLDDRRIFGTTGRKSISDDFKRDYISYPASLLRGNGVIHGMEVVENTTTATPSIDIIGGEALVNGSIVLVQKTNISIPLDTGTVTFNVFIDSDNVVQILKDNSLSGLITSSLSEIINSSDKLMLAQVDYTDTPVITEIRDYRKFVENLDSKIDLIVGSCGDESGSFISLRSAINYLNAQYPSHLISKTLRVRGVVEYDLSQGPLTLPDGVIIEGDNVGNIVGDGYGSKIRLSGTTSSGFIIPGDQCMIKNLNIECIVGSSCSFLIVKQGEINGLRVENCNFSNTTATTSIISALSLVDCVIKDCYAEVSSTGFMSGIFVYGDSLNNVIVENNVCNSLTNGITSFVASGLSSFFSAGSCLSTNVWIRNNKFSAGSLAGMVSGIHIVNCTNVFIEENIIEFTNSDFGLTFTCGVIDLVGKAQNCKISNNKITYKNDSIAANNVWQGFPNTGAYYCCYAIGINSPIDLIFFGANVGTMDIKDIVIENNYINTMSVAGIVVGVGNGIGSGIIIKNNTIEDSYLVGFGIVVGNTRTDLTYTQPVISGVIIEGNYVRNSIEITDYSEYTDILTMMYMPTGLITVGGIDYANRGYYNDVVISNNVIENDFIAAGIPHGIVVERCNNLHIANNHVKNCGLVSVDALIQSQAIRIDGANNCFIKDNILEDCNMGVYIKGNTVESLVFGTNASIEGNHITSSVGDDSVGDDFIVKFEDVFGRFDFNNNEILNSSSKTYIVYLENCNCDRNICKNNISSTEDIYSVITLTGTGGIYNTFVNDNIIRVTGRILFDSIAYFESGNTSGVYINNNIISGDHVTSGIIVICLGAHTLSNLFVDGNIINHTNISTQSTGSLLYVNAVLSIVNANIKNNIFVGRATAMNITNITGLEIYDNQLVGSTKTFTPTTYYGILCTTCNFISIRRNLVFNYNSLIHVIGSFAVSGQGTISISDNTLNNSLIDFNMMIRVSETTNCDISITNNNVHCNTCSRSIVIEGDSISTAAVLTNWPFQMPNYSSLFGQSVITNYATSGDTAANMVTTYAATCHTKRPVNVGDEGWFFLMAGVNDLAADDTADHICTNLKSLWASARADGFTVVAFTVIDSTGLTASQKAQRDLLNNEIRSSSSLYDYLIHTDSVLDGYITDTDYFSDGTHPTALGSQLIANEVAITVIPVYVDGPTGPWTQRTMVECDTLTLCRAFICGNNLYSLTKVQFGIGIVNSNINLTNIVISDNNLSLSEVAKTTGSCIAVVGLGAATLTNCTIADNSIWGANLYGSGIDVSFVSDIKDLNVNNNIILSLSNIASAPSDCMIKIISTTLFTKNMNVSNNILQNLSTTGYGVSNGIGILAAVNGINISGNIINYAINAIVLAGTQVLNAIICDNQMVGTSVSFETSVTTSYGISCIGFNFINISRNLVFNFNAPIRMVGSATITDIMGVISISDNIVSNSSIDFNMMIRVSDITSCDVSIMNNNVHCNIVNVASPWAQRTMVECDALELCRTFICGNNLYSLTKVQFGIGMLNSTLDLDNVVISDNNLLLEVAKTTGSCIAVVGLGTTILKNCLITNNLISGNLYGSGIYISLASTINDLNVNSNRIFSSSGVVSAATDCMIKITSTFGFNINVSHNILQNESTSGFGVYCGIGILTTFNGMNISGNIISYAINSIVVMSGAIASSYAIISENTIMKSSIGISLMGLMNYITVSNNFAETSSGFYAIVVGSTVYNYAMKNIVITGNTLLNTDATPTVPLLFVYSTAGEQIVITNNMFNSAHSGSLGNGVLWATAYAGCSIVGNHFSVVGGTSAKYITNLPIIVVTTVADSICTLNNLRGIEFDTFLSPKIGITGSNYNNFGENYSITIPIESFSIPTNYAGQSAWCWFDPDTFGALSNLFISNTNLSNYNILSASFGVDLVPIGAIINYIDVIYTILTGTVAELQMAWQSRDTYNVVFTDVRAFANVHAAGPLEMERIVPASYPEIMAQGGEHLIKCKVDATSHDLAIHAAKVHYTL